MVARRRVQIDERTTTMSKTALMCRTIGHHPVFFKTPPLLRAQHRRKGERLIMLRCDHQIDVPCPYARDIIADYYSGKVLHAKSGYQDGGKDYLVQATGTGRLPRAAARVAFFAAVGDD